MFGALARIRSLWKVLRRRSGFEAEMDEEFRFHLEQRAADLAARGMSPAEAMRRARMEFGSTDRYKDEARESRGLRHFDELRGDLRHASRTLRSAPGVTAAALLMLALGIGVNAAVFSLVSANLLRPLPFEGADRLVVLHQTTPGANAVPVRWSYPEFQAVRPSLTSFSHLAAYYSSDVNLSGAGIEPLRVHAEMVSASYLEALGIRPVVGRSFLPHEDSIPGMHPVVILGHEFWMRAFGGDAGAVGGSIVLNGVTLTVIGVATPGFRGLTGEAELWFPQAMAPSVSFDQQLTTPQHFQSVVGRVRPGVSLNQARAEVAIVGARAADSARERAGTYEEETRGWGASLLSLDEARRQPGETRAQLVLAGAALFVLLIAIVNVTGLLLARAVARAREVATRAALGAGRFRLVRQGAVEGALLGLLGGAFGILLAVWGVRSLVVLAPARMNGIGPRAAKLASFGEPTVDWRVIVFGVALSIVTGVLAGTLPALRATRGDLTSALKAGARGSSAGVGSLRRPTLLSAAAVAQVACALVLLVSAGLLVQEFDRLRSLDPGFEPAGVLTFQITPAWGEYSGDAAAPLLERVLERVDAVPGVRSATVSLCTPLAGCSSTSLHVAGQPAPERAPIVGRHYVGPDHFQALGIPLLRGRALTAEDRAGRPHVAVINETAARRFWPDEDPIGKQVWFGSGGPFASPDAPTEIVGVVGDVLYAAPGEPIGPDFYTSYLQFTWPYTTVIVRASVDPLSLVPALRSAIAEVDPQLPIHTVGTMESRAAAALASERFATAALTVFAGLGLLLASLGIYGIMSYFVEQRRREIGIRLALGSTPREILRFVVGQGAALAGAGLVVGALAALALTRVLPALVSNVGSADPIVFLAVVPILLSVALLACYLPARAATRVNPMEAIAAN